MKKLNENIPVILFMIFLLFSCRNNDKEKNDIINEITVIKKLTNNNFYQHFYFYNIRNRTDNIYIISTSAIKEFWVEFNEDGEITFFKNSEKDLEKQLKAIYHNKYSEIKKKYLSDLNQIIPFLFSYGIKSAIHVKMSKLYFRLTNGKLIERYKKAAIQKEVDSLKAFYKSIKIVDSNWVVIQDLR